MKRSILLMLCVVLILSLAACERNTTEPDRQMIRLAYISKDLKHYWFQQVVSGIRSRCMEYGIEYSAFDAHFDDETCMNQVDEIIAEGYDGLMICTTNQQLGAEIGKKCAEANIPVVTIDDTMRDHKGSTFSHVGMATREVGGIGGVALAKLANDRGFFDEGNRTAILELTVNSLSVFQERLDGYNEALFTNADLTADDIVLIDTPDGMYENNRAALSAYFSEHDSSDVTHWIICGANDDCALSCMHQLRDMGFDMDHVIGCGLGGYELSIQEFEEGNPNYISIMLQPDVEGSKATELLYNCLVNDQPMSSSLLLGGKLATCDNYLVYFNYSKLTR